MAVCFSVFCVFFCVYSPQKESELDYYISHHCWPQVYLDSCCKSIASALLDLCVTLIVCLFLCWCFTDDTLKALCIVQAVCWWSVLLWSGVCRGKQWQQFIDKTMMMMVLLYTKHFSLMWWGVCVCVCAVLFHYCLLIGSAVSFVNDIFANDAWSRLSLATWGVFSAIDYLKQFITDRTHTSVFTLRALSQYCVWFIFVALFE